MNISFNNSAWIYCKSRYYTCYDAIDESRIFTFETGLNSLIGEIDSGIFAISYILSMGRTSKRAFFATAPVVTVDGEEMELSEFSALSCYVDESYPLISKRKTVRQMINEGLKKSKLKLTADNIIELFKLSDDRVDRRLNEIGNERFRAMVAICFANNKKVFCFPWMSESKINDFKGHISFVIDLLSKHGAVIILPSSKPI